MRRRRGLVARLKRYFNKLALVLVVAACALLVGRIYDTQRGLPLALWHTHVPYELDRKDVSRATWSEYVARENDIFQKIRDQVSAKIEPRDKNAANRYFVGSPVNPVNFQTDWNRSFILQPIEKPRGVAVFFHGLTDSPYSVRHLAVHYRKSGFVAVAIRLPGHGTVPGALTKVEWEDWVQAAHLAVREGRKLAEKDAPLHLVGYSNGGALALIYALDAIEDKSLPSPQKIVLISPMIGVTAFARFAGVAGLPAILPSFAKAAWLSIVPEFNPFKFNSFPVNGARQSHLLTRVLQNRIRQLQSAGRLENLAPIITFQSVLDSTVSTSALTSALYDLLPANGSELVLFDINRSKKFGPLIRPSAEASAAAFGAPSYQKFTTRLLTNRADNALEMTERITLPNSTSFHENKLALSYPADVFSLSHIALPYPIDDSLYGLHPSSAEDFGVNLGAIAVRGERGALVTGLDSLLRMSSNPFFPYLLARIDSFAELEK